MTEFIPGARVVVDHPRHGRHYGRVLAVGDPAEQIFDVQIEGGYINPWQVLGAWMSSAAEGQRDMVIGDLLNLAMLKAAIEVEFEGSLWTKGDSGMLTPYVCETSFGDGLKLLTISTINQRPNYHVVRIHSAWEQSNWSTGDNVGEHIDEIIAAIEEECGSGRPYEPDDELYDADADAAGYGDRDPWPAIDDRDGCSWGYIRWDWLMKKIGYAAMIDRLCAEPA